MPLTWHTLFHTTDGIAAVGTIALAMATAVLAVGTILTARGTKKTAMETHSLAEATVRLAELTETEVRAVADQASAAREEVEVSRRALQASVKPHLLNVPRSDRGSSGRITYEHPNLPSLTSPAAPDLTSTWIKVPFRNVGPGLAFIQRAVMYWNEIGGASNNPAPYEGTAPVKVVPPGEEGFAHFWFGDELSSTRALKIAEDAKEFWAEVTYTDGAGEQPERTRFTLRLGSDGDQWVVKGVAVFRGDADEPYVSSAVQ